MNGSVFGWVKNLKTAHLIIIGIANALDLIERLLSGLQERSIYPIHIVFPPYSKDQIAKIVSSRLVGAPAESSQLAFDNVALQFCAKKV